jgi:hypothetical protein
MNGMVGGHRIGFIASQSRKKIFFCGGDLTQGVVHTRQALYHLSISRKNLHFFPPTFFFMKTGNKQ